MLEIVAFYWLLISHSTQCMSHVHLKLWALKKIGEYKRWALKKKKFRRLLNHGLMASHSYFINVIFKRFFLCRTFLQIQTINTRTLNTIIHKIRIFFFQKKFFLSIIKQSKCHVWKRKRKKKKLYFHICDYETVAIFFWAWLENERYNTTRFGQWLNFFFLIYQQKDSKTKTEYFAMQRPTILMSKIL